MYLTDPKRDLPLYLVLPPALIGNWDFICAARSNYRPPMYKIVASQPLPLIGDEPDDEDPDNPDDWREYAEDHETCADERADFDGWPRF
jgi:hypothetical protein